MIREDINYITGNALEPVGEGKKIIVHVCNDIGGWGSGFVVAISKRWKVPEYAYRYWYQENKNPDNKDFFETFHLGMVQPVLVEPYISVVNMIAQHNTISSEPGSTPIKYDALTTCLEKVTQYIAEDLTDEESSVHMPRIGCGLAGGKWEEIEKIVRETLVYKGIPTYVYTLEGDKSWR